MTDSRYTAYCGLCYLDCIPSDSELFELVDDFKQQARLAGVAITLLQSRDGKQRLLKVVGPPGSAEPEDETSVA